jgi:hypothetical protein
VSNGAQRGSNRAMTDPEQREIDWASAEIHGGTLTVELSGERHKRWSEQFSAVLTLVDRGESRWGDIEITKDGIVVAAVQEGSEADLRHLLESVVLQVNSDLSPDREDSSTDEYPQREADERQQTAFRAFAEPDS